MSCDGVLIHCDSLWFIVVHCGSQDENEVRVSERRLVDVTLTFSDAFE